MKLKKAIALILASQMLLMSFAACEKTDGDKDKEGSGETTIRTDVADNLPEVTFDGQDFRFVVNPDERYQLVIDDSSGDALDESIINRNRTVESRFDVKITADVSSAVQGEWESQWVIQQLFLSDDYQYEVCDMWQRMSLEIPGNFFGFYNWLDVPYINWDQPWWNKESNEGSTFNGKMWTVSGALSLTAMQYMYILAYNMDLLAEYGYTSQQINDIVFNGEWTLDKLAEITSEIYVDTNQNGLSDVGDTYGYMGFPEDRTLPWVTAIGEKSLAASEDGTKLEVKLNTEKVHSALEKLCNLTWNTKGSLAKDGNIQEFVDGRIGIMTTMFKSCFSAFTDLNFSYGVLPFPKYDKAQEGYYTIPNYDFSVYAIAANVPEDKLDMIGIIMEAMSAESWKSVYPAYYDDALKGRYSADADTAKMVDLIAEGCQYDFAYQCAIWLSCKVPFLFCYSLRDNTTDLASQLAEGQSHLDERLPQIMYFYGIPLPEGIEPAA